VGRDVSVWFRASVLLRRNHIQLPEQILQIGQFVQLLRLQFTHPAAFNFLMDEICSITARH
jgi:hypothetical protein